ncbi:Transmembrane protein C2orf18 [Tetrabaena socialis]|uniref:Transmembrane protein C2orf18 n=1 Tax=Tetrabaena socialis TaxID=47790 RepID=A0A2J8AFT7_9CHLO|nr:Transmembrane protein C2orf18 [Tetrabaena socialis]|eukprot:PNH11378.1 Transmembrane protein C2orf18 [Tetrabaena socialis]
MPHPDHLAPPMPQHHSLVPPPPQLRPPPIPQARSPPPSPLRPVWSRGIAARPARAGVVVVVVVVYRIMCASGSLYMTLSLGGERGFASTYQMLRGTLVIFAGFFTVLLLRRPLYSHHWLGMALIVGGAALVGAASVLSAHGAPAEGGPAGLAEGARRLVYGLLRGEPGVDAASAPLFGDLCVVAAQAFTALQHYER